MALVTSILTGGSNSHATSSEEANALRSDLFGAGFAGVLTNTSGVAPATGAFALNAQGTPDTTVAVSTGVAYVTATPSSQNSQLLRVKNSATASVTISANSSGSTKYDWIYLSISAANAANPNSAADNVATLVTSRSSSASTDDGTPPTYGLLIGVVTVANGFSTITNGTIADSRVNVTNISVPSLRAERVYTGTTTWTRPSAMVGTNGFVIVEVLAGGGGGGGCAAASAGQASAGRPGGAGGYSREKIPAASLSSTETVTVGAAGTAGTAGNNAGGNGGTSSFGTSPYLTATGGTGGGGGATAVTVAGAAGGAGGVGTNGDVNLTGQTGGIIIRVAASSIVSIGGGSTIYGAGAPGNATSGASTSTAGTAASGFGSGGGGGSASDSGASAAGGAGTAGLVVVREYY